MHTHCRCSRKGDKPAIFLFHKKSLHKHNAMKGNRRRKDRLSRFPCPDGRLIQKIPVHVVISTFIRQFRYLFRLCLQDSTETKPCQGFSIWFMGLGAGEWGIGNRERRFGAESLPCRQKIVFAHRWRGQLTRGPRQSLPQKEASAFGNAVSCHQRRQMLNPPSPALP